MSPSVCSCFRTTFPFKTMPTYGTRVKMEAMFQQALDLQMEKFKGGVCFSMVAVGCQLVTARESASIWQQIENELQSLKLGMMQAFGESIGATPASAMQPVNDSDHTPDSDAVCSFIEPPPAASGAEPQPSAQNNDSAMLQSMPVGFMRTPLPGRGKAKDLEEDAKVKRQLTLCLGFHGVRCLSNAWLNRKKHKRCRQCSNAQGSEEVLAMMTQQMNRDADPRRATSVSVPLMHHLHAAGSVVEQPPEQSPEQWLMQRRDINMNLERNKISNKALSKDAYVRLEQHSYAYWNEVAYQVVSHS